jgi:GNAT superfamily N-acetyltransferase
VLAAKAQDRYVGYAFVRIRSGTDFAASWDASERLAELVILAMLPDWRGKGVGSALLDVLKRPRADRRCRSDGQSGSKARCEQWRGRTTEK